MQRDGQGLWKQRELKRKRWTQPSTGRAEPEKHLGNQGAAESELEAESARGSACTWERLE